MCYVDTMLLDLGCLCQMGWPDAYHSSAEQVSVADTRESTGKSVPERSVGEVSSDGDGKDLDSRQVGTLSRILLAVVIKHYGFRPFDAALTKNQEKAKDAVYEPIFKLTS